ncbi:MAG: twin-arginine translocation signal domain-containing protein, partial [Solirubrobacteraceae bacterium]|nr:twin-arginine translocation signal domain-containing protein [Solirubrobacteraceae bacterium]
MDGDRREFLKAATVAAAGAAGAALLLDDAAIASEAPAGGKRWAMVIDPRKCLREDGCTACVAACHRAHNVPDIPNRKHEVKWIWKERYTEAFPDQEAHYIDEALTSKPVLVFCNHC